MYQPPKVWALDIDYTLLHEKPTALCLPHETLFLHPATKSMLIRAQLRFGLTFILATGRRKEFCLPLAQDLCADWVICEHGGLIVDWHQQMFHDWLGRLADCIGSGELLGQSGTLWDYARQLQEEGYIIRRKGRVASFTIKLNEPGRQEHAVEQLRKRQHPAEVAARENRFDEIEFWPERAGKGRAFTYLLQQLGVERSNSAAVGDDVSDVELLKAAGIPCTFPDAHPACREVVQRRGGFIATTTQHAGTQEIIRHLVAR